AAPNLGQPAPAADASALINTDSLHNGVPATPLSVVTNTEPGSDAPTLSLCTLIATLLRRGVAPMVADNAELGRETCALADAFETFGTDPLHQDLDVRVHALREKLEWAADDQGAIRQALLGLLQLIVTNISELVIDDNWLRGQLGLLTEVFSGP